MSPKRIWRSWGWAAAAGVVLVVVGVLVGLAGEVSESEPADSKAIPVDSRLAYKVEYLGITCGHMTLESWLGDYRGAPWRTPAISPKRGSGRSSGTPSIARPEWSVPKNTERSR